MSWNLLSTTFFDGMGSRSITANFSVNTLFLIKFVSVQCRTSKASTGSDQSTFPAANQAADKCPGSRSDGHIRSVSMATIKAGLFGVHPIDVSVPYNPSLISLLGLNIFRHGEDKRSRK